MDRQNAHTLTQCNDKKKKQNEIACNHKMNQPTLQIRIIVTLIENIQHQFQIHKTQFDRKIAHFIKKNEQNTHTTNTDDLFEH